MNALKFIEDNDFGDTENEAKEYGTGFHRLVGNKGGSLSGG